MRLRERERDQSIRPPAMESEENQEEEEDRISQLPDGVLHDILSNSCLLMEDAVRTCVLSKRWRDLWASMPHLAFDYNRTWIYRSGCSLKEKDVGFAHFVCTSLLLRRDNTTMLRKFYLRWSREGGFHRHMPEYLATWMKYAVRHNVKDLDIAAFLRDTSLEQQHPPPNVVDKMTFELPRCVFACQSLECLSLNITISGRVVSVPDDGVVNLQRLTRLELEDATISSISLKALMSGCPVLQGMLLDGCNLQDPDFSSNSLKTMVIAICEIRGTRVRIASPKLEDLFFHLNDTATDSLEISLENLSSLVKAEFQISDCSDDLIHPKPLRFIGPTTESLSEKELSGCSTFYNLKALTLHDVDMVENFPAVIHFLQRSPNLDRFNLITAGDCIQEFSRSQCPHFKMSITISGDGKEDRILELLTEFLNRKCCCL